MQRVGRCYIREQGCSAHKLTKINCRFQSVTRELIALRSSNLFGWPRWKNLRWIANVSEARKCSSGKGARSDNRDLKRRPNELRWLKIIRTFRTRTSIWVIKTTSKNSWPWIFNNPKVQYYYMYRGDRGKEGHRIYLTRKFLWN